MNLKKPSLFFITINAFLTILIIFSPLWGILLWLLFLIIYYFLKRDHFLVPVQDFIKLHSKSNDDPEAEIGARTFLAPVEGLIKGINRVKHIIPEIEFKISGEWYELEIEPHPMEIKKDKNYSPFFTSLAREIGAFYWQHQNHLWVQMGDLYSKEYYWICFSLDEFDKKGQHRNFIRLLPGDRILLGGQLSSLGIEKPFKIYLATNDWNLLAKEKDSIKLLSTLIAEKK